MIALYVSLISKELKTLEDVPDIFRKDVKKALDNDNKQSN